MKNLFLTAFLVFAAFVSSASAAKLVVAIHLPLMIIEGIITMFTVLFLSKVQPEFLGIDQ